MAVRWRVRTSVWSLHRRCFYRCREDGKLRCPAGASLWLSEVRQENAFTQRAVYLAYQTDCQPCALREQCLASGAKGDRARRVSAVRRLLPPPATVERKPIVLGPIRWVDVAGRALRRAWTAHWRRQYVEVLVLGRPSEGVASSPPPACRALASSLELARPARPQCLVGTTAPACHRRWRSRSSRCEVRHEEKLATEQTISMLCHLPLNRSRGLRSCVYFPQPACIPFLAWCLLPIPMAMSSHQTIRIHERRTRAISFGRDTRCASRGLSLRFGE